MRSSLVVPIMLIAVVSACTEPEAQPAGATAHDQGGDSELSPLEEYLGEVAGRPWSDADPESLRELQEFEIEVASADEACRAEHFNDAFREVRTELEAEFVEEHRQELEQHRERLAEGR